MATHSYGTVLRKGGSEIAQVREITGPSNELNDVDASYLNMTNPVREFVAGLSTPGELTFTMLMTSGSLNTIYTDYLARSNNTYTLTWPNGSSWSFSAYPKKVEPKTQLDDVIMVDCSLKISGKPTFNP